MEFYYELGMLCTTYTVQGIVYIVQRTSKVVHSTTYSVHVAAASFVIGYTVCDLYNPNYMSIYFCKCLTYSVRRTMFIKYCIIYIIRCTVYVVKCSASTVRRKCLTYSVYPVRRTVF